MASTGWEVTGWRGLGFRNDSLWHIFSGSVLSLTKQKQKEQLGGSYDAQAR